jgi:NADPH:quinone reductase-like Zn-dependent oxidoreductase
MGAEVTGVASTQKLDFVRSLGADAVIDYRTTDWTTTGKRYDWIVDTDSHVAIWRARRALAKGGVYVTLGGTSWPILGGLVLGPLLSIGSDKWSGLLLWWKPFHKPDVDRLKELFAQGAFRPRIDRRFRLDEVVAALDWVNDGKARGKVVLTMETHAGESPGP